MQSTQMQLETPARAEVRASSGAVAAQSASTERLLSLDVYRGLIMIVLVSHGFGFTGLGNDPTFGWIAAQFQHAEWTGVTFWDLIQPAFTFMVGVAMPLAMAKREAQGQTPAEIFRHVAWRAIGLIALSNILSNFGSGAARPSLQFINVLAQIGFGYFLCFLILRLPVRVQVAAAAAILAAHWALFVLFPGPEGPFSRTGNIGAVIDKAVLGYNYNGHYTTINFLGNAMTILFGGWAGRWLMSSATAARKVQLLLLAAAGAFAAGLLLELAVPMVKRLWTVSFTFFSAGWVVLMLAAIYWLVEIRRSRSWAFPFLVVGANSLFIYSFSQVLHGWLDRGLGVFTLRYSFFGSAGAILQACTVLAAMWCLCLWLYRRKIFFKF